MVARRERFVSTKQFLETARSYDITTEECILEALDNSFDADSQEIRIDVGKNDRGEIEVVVCDDGVGIPATHVDDEGVAHQGIPYVLAYGGRIPHKGKPTTIGKFGWGLSQAASSLSRRTEVYTKTEEDKDWRHGYYDFEELEKDQRCELPVEILQRPPWIDLPETGTIVIFQMDRSDYKNVGSLVNMLEKSLGRTYRKFLAMGRNLSIIYEVNDKPQIREIGKEDPLHQMPGSREVGMFGPSKGPYDVTIKLDGSNSLGQITDPVTGQDAEIHVRMCLLDSRDIRKKLGIRSTGAGGFGGGTNPELTKWGITTENQGFSVIRNGREIRNGETLGLWPKHGDYTFVRAEIEFPEVLDRLFNVQVNKSRLTITHSLRNVLDQRCMGTVRDLVREHKRGVSRAHVRRAKREISTAEVVAGILSDTLPKPKVTDKERKEAKIEIEKRVAAKLSKAESEGQQAISEAKETLDKAKKSSDEERISTAKKALAASEERKEEAVTAIRNRFAFESPVRKEIDVLGSGDMYAIEHLGDEVWITMNMDTPFFRMVYERALMNAEMESLIDLMIFAMAWAEHLKKDEPSIKQFWEEARPRVSQIAHTFCNSMRLEEES